MDRTETLKQYYQLTKKEVPKELLCSHGATSHLNVLKRMNCSMSLPFQRRDYYKISLINSPAILHTADQTIKIDRPCILFFSPEIEYGWQNIPGDQVGYICLFNAEFLSAELKSLLKKLFELFSANAFPLIFLSSNEYVLFMSYFSQLEAEYRGDFKYKDDIINNLLTLIIYLGVKIQLEHSPESNGNEDSSSRIVALFMDLLDRQFPVESPFNAILYKSPGDFAAQLHVHVNHLNHCLKVATGKSTTNVINERIVSEAIDLLKNTDWTITQIGNSLGFEYPQHFNLFFKKITGKNPKDFRMSSNAHI